MKTPKVPIKEIKIHILIKSKEDIPIAKPIRE
jgi:hypothetical protein